VNRLRQHRALAFVLIAALLVVVVVPAASTSPVALLSLVWFLFVSLCVASFVVEVVREREQPSSLCPSLVPRAPPAFS